MKNCEVKLYLADFEHGCRLKLLHFHLPGDPRSAEKNCIA